LLVSVGVLGLEGLEAKLKVGQILVGRILVSLTICNLLSSLKQIVLRFPFEEGQLLELTVVLHSFLVRQDC